MLAVKPACCEGSHSLRSSSTSKKAGKLENKFQGELQRFTRAQGGRQNCCESKPECDNANAFQEPLDQFPLPEGIPETNFQNEEQFALQDSAAEPGKDTVLQLADARAATNEEMIVLQGSTVEPGRDTVSQLADARAKANEETRLPLAEELMNEAKLAAANALAADNEQQSSGEKIEAVKASENMEPVAFIQPNGSQKIADPNSCAGDQASTLPEQVGLTGKMQEPSELPEAAEGKRDFPQSRQFYDVREEGDAGKSLQAEETKAPWELGQLSANTNPGSQQPEAEESQPKDFSSSWLTGLSGSAKNSDSKLSEKDEQGPKHKASELANEQGKNPAVSFHNKKESKEQPVLKNLLNLEAEEKAPQEKASTDVKKLIEFESKRLSASKLEKDLPRNEEMQSDKKPNDSSKFFVLGTKAEIGTSKSIVQESNILNANKTPVEAKEIVEQLVKKAELLLKLNSSEMKIQLKPEYLGKMTIKVVMDEGVLTARFITESHQVKQILESNLANLRQSLESQGIRVEKTEVSVQLNNGGMFDGSEGNQQEIWQENRNWFYHGRDNNSGEEAQLSAETDELEMEEENFYYPQDYGLDANGSMNLLI